MKHNQMNAFVGFMIVLATITIVSIVTYRIMSTTREQELTNEAGCNATAKTSCGAAYNAIGELEDANDEVIDWIPIYIIAAIGFLIIGLFAFNKLS